MALITNLVAYYKLDESSGNALDAHGSNPGADGNSVGTAAGKIGTSRSFNGSNNYFNFGDAAAFEFASGQSFSFAWWMKAAGVATQLGLLTKGYDGVFANDDRPWYLCRWNATGTSGDLDFYLRDVAGNSATVVAAGLGDDAWHHVAVVYDGAANTLTIYADNALKQQATGVPAAAYGTNSSPLVVGTHAAGYYNGLLDELGVWKGYALTAQDRTDLYNGGAGLAYPFSVGGGAVAYPAALLI